MAWIFSLSAECGHDKHQAEAVAKHFDGYIAALDDGSRYTCSSGVSEIDGAWWAVCCPDGVSRTGINSDDDKRIMTAVGLLLYDVLKTSPSYRYAIVGVEVDGFRQYHELDSDVTDLDFTGLVLSEAVWRRLGAPGIFLPFVSGYQWRPFVRAR